MIYLDNEADELIGSLEGKGTIINNLIKDHFANDEETLRRKLMTAETEVATLKAKINVKIQARMAVKKAEEEQAKVTEEEEERQKKADEWKRKWIDEEINDNTYYDGFVNGKFEEEAAASAYKKWIVKN